MHAKVQFNVDGETSQLIDYIAIEQNQTAAKSARGLFARGLMLWKEETPDWQNKFNQYRIWLIEKSKQS